LFTLLFNVEEVILVEPATEVEIDEEITYLLVHNLEETEEVIYVL
jgi:hypothetical protein